LGSYLLVNQAISLGQFLASEILIVTLLSAVEKVILTVENIYDSGIALEKLGYITDAHLHEEPKDAKHLTQNKSPELCIISKLNSTTLLQINSGDKIGICGIPGSGRTRILKTLTGEFQTDWHTLVNNIPLENIDLQSLGQITGLCLQGNDVFEDTLARNIALGQPINLDEIAHLADILNLHKYTTFISGGFNHKVDAELGLPTNIMRKIVLARALYGKPKLLLIDDIWSVFNRQEIENIMQYINTLNCTTIVISNYAPILESLDKCYFMEESVFLDLGNFDTKNINSSIKSVIWL